MSELAAQTQAALEIGAAFAPLAAIELAASRLLREATTPAAQALARNISDAVREIDAQLAAGLALLDATPLVPRHDADVLPALRALIRRATPALAAREVELRAALAEELVWPGDPDLVGSAASLLLRAASARAGRGGRCELRLEGVSDRTSLAVHWRSGIDATRRETTDGDATPRLHALAARYGGVVEARGDCQTGVVAFSVPAGQRGAR